MSKEEFDKAVKAQQDIQKVNPYGSPEHRAADVEIRRLVLEMHSIDIGEYES